MKIKISKRKISWEPFRICLLNIAQPIQPIFTQIGLDWLCYLAGKSLTAPRIFFRFHILIFKYFSKYETIESHARAFFSLNISAVGIVEAIWSKNPLRIRRILITYIIYHKNSFRFSDNYTRHLALSDTWNVPPCSWR